MKRCLGAEEFHSQIPRCMRIKSNDKGIALRRIIAFGQEKRITNICILQTRHAGDYLSWRETGFLFRLFVIITRGTGGQLQKQKCDEKSDNRYFPVHAVVLFLIKFIKEGFKNKNYSRQSLIFKSVRMVASHS